MAIKWHFALTKCYVFQFFFLLLLLPFRVATKLSCRTKFIYFLLLIVAWRWIIKICVPAFRRHGHGMPHHCKNVFYALTPICTHTHIAHMPNCRISDVLNIAYKQNFFPCCLQHIYSFRIFIDIFTVQVFYSSNTTVEFCSFLFALTTNICNRTVGLGQFACCWHLWENS